MKRVVRNKLDIYHLIDTSADGLLISESITHPVVSALRLLIKIF